MSRFSKLCPTPITQLRVPEVMLRLLPTAESKFDLLRRISLDLKCDEKTLLLKVAVNPAGSGRNVVFACAAFIPKDGQSNFVETDPDWHAVSIHEDQPLSVFKGSS